MLYFLPYATTDFKNFQVERFSFRCFFTDRFMSVFAVIGLLLLTLRSHLRENYPSRGHTGLEHIIQTQELECYLNWTRVNWISVQHTPLFSYWVLHFCPQKMWVVEMAERWKIHEILRNWFSYSDHEVDGIYVSLEGLYSLAKQEE